MELIYEDQCVRSILEKADTIIDAFGYKAVVVETGTSVMGMLSEFQGTILYFPGIRAKYLKKVEYNKRP